MPPNDRRTQTTIASYAWALLMVAHPSASKAQDIDVITMARACHFATVHQNENDSVAEFCKAVRVGRNWNDALVTALKRLPDAAAIRNAAHNNPDTSTGNVMLTLAFRFNSDQIEPVGERRLRAMAPAVKAYLDQVDPSTLKDPTKHEITIYGWTDAFGPPDANLLLAYKRAEAIRTVLADEGVDPSRLRIQACPNFDPKLVDKSFAMRADSLAAAGQMTTCKAEGGEAFAIERSAMLKVEKVDSAKLKADTGQKLTAAIQRIYTAAYAPPISSASAPAPQVGQFQVTPIGLANALTDAVIAQVQSEIETDAMAEGLRRLCAQTFMSESIRTLTPHGCSWEFATTDVLRRQGITALRAALAHDLRDAPTVLMTAASRHRGNLPSGYAADLIALGYMAQTIAEQQYEPMALAANISNVVSLLPAGEVRERLKNATAFATKYGQVTSEAAEALGETANPEAFATVAIQTLIVNIRPDSANAEALWRSVGELTALTETSIRLFEHQGSETDLASNIVQTWSALAGDMALAHRWKYLASSVMQVRAATSAANYRDAILTLADAADSISAWNGVTLRSFAASEGLDSTRIFAAVDSLVSKGKSAGDTALSVAMLSSWKSAKPDQRIQAVRTAINVYLDTLRQRIWFSNSEVRRSFGLVVDVGTAQSGDEMAEAFKRYIGEGDGYRAKRLQSDDWHDRQYLALNTYLGGGISADIPYRGQVALMWLPVGLEFGSRHVGQPAGKPESSWGWMLQLFDLGAIAAAHLGTDSLSAPTRIEQVFSPGLRFVHSFGSSMGAWSVGFSDARAAIQHSTGAAISVMRADVSLGFDVPLLITHLRGRSQ